MRASDVVAIARGELGVMESPAGSNRVKYNTWYYGREVSGSAYPWCMAFVQWVCDKAGGALTIKTASCTALMNYAKQNGRWVTKGYRAGDIILYQFDKDAYADHVGICEEVGADTVTCIEGNTSVSGSQSNGGQVCRKVRKTKLVMGAYRPEYQEEEMEDEEMTYETFKEYMDQYMAGLKSAKPSDWSREERAWAEETGLIQGSDNGDKQYKAFCTREQMVTFLYRLFHMLGK